MKKVLLGISILISLCFISFAQYRSIPQKVNQVSGIACNHFDGFSGLTQKQMNPSFENTLADIQGVKYVADTIYLGYKNDSVRNIRTYDPNGKLLTQLDEHWYNAWVYPHRLTYRYDVNANLLEILGEYKEGTTWKKDSKVSYTYDATGQMLTKLSETYLYNALKNADRNTYTYDASGHVLTDFYEYWYKSAWVKGEKQTFTYDAGGRKLTFLDERWQSPTNLISKLRTYTYDSNGNVLNSVEQYLSQNKWENAYRITYTYDENQHLVLERSEMFGGSSWSEDWKYVYTYDSQGNLLTSTSKYEGYNSTKTTYTYDPDGNLLTYLYQKWADTDWQNQTTIIYTYDSHGNTSTGKSYEWVLFQNKWIYSDDNFLEINANGQYYESIKNRRIRVHWQELNTTSVKNIPENKELLVYPNPATDRIILHNQGEKAIATIYNLNGQQVIQQQLIGNSIDIHPLLPGCYTVVISNKSKTVSCKFMKQ